MEGPDTAGSEHDEDEIWRELVARFDFPADGEEEGTAPWPPEEGLDRTSSGTRVIKPADPQARPLPAGEPELEPDDGEEFVPPPAPPLPHLDPITKAAWLALFGGPAYLLVSIGAGWTVPGWAAFCAVAAFVGGFITLVMRMSDERPDDSADDGGPAG